MRPLICCLLWLWTHPARAIDPDDVRLRMPTGKTFVRFCSSLLGSKPYQISYRDPRAKTVRQYYALLNGERLKKATDLYADDSVYQDGPSIYIGKSAIAEKLTSSVERRSGHFRILDVSWRNHQLFVLVNFEGIQDGTPYTVDFLEVWVLNSSGQIYYANLGAHEGLTHGSM